ARGAGGPVPDGRDGVSYLHASAPEAWTSCRMGSTPRLMASAATRAVFWLAHTAFSSGLTTCMMSVQRTIEGSGCRFVAPSVNTLMPFGGWPGAAKAGLVTSALSGGTIPTAWM